ncbi:Uncharacterised protein [Zhongshania aliphaticivorans]|uniref:Uncharacterized protein n=1 Tax=Zhongshania aliphaticivorans TaxID=1470434 RepID=A0A5S9P4W4_9GAMM|nr:hypothetical protein [Zhongshania aliphaticivorans]CAA0090868.1 Uncharacterised protein [Zhongshania aliphaticivorans]CAA0098367.1 Uncharacterised protein [Zhongshania aliphaticivorans]
MSLNEKHSGFSHGLLKNLGVDCAYIAKLEVSHDGYLSCTDLLSNGFSPLVDNYLSSDY